MRAKTPARAAATTSTPFAPPATAPSTWSPVPGPALSTVDLPDPVPDAVVPEDEPSTPNGDVVEQLKTLADLRERGMLDEDEYEKAKHAVLGEDGGS